MEENQREYYLREQIKAISEELNEGGGAISEAEEYKEQIRAIGFSEDTERKLLRECDRLMKMQSSSPESAVIRNYLDKVISLPWGYCTEENLDIEKYQEELIVNFNKNSIYDLFTSIFSGFVLGFFFAT